MFITFEGIEGSGKSSVAGDAAEYLRGLGLEVLLTREPGGCGFGLALRAQLLDPANTGLSHKAELFLYLADRAQHVHEVILPGLKAGQVVICDRYTDSTLAYQGYGRGQDLRRLREFNAFAAADCRPELTLLLDLPVEKGLARARSRNALENKTGLEDRFEAETLAFHQRVREGFLALSAEEPQRFVVLNADWPLPEVKAEVRGVLKHYLKLHTEELLGDKA